MKPVYFSDPFKKEFKKLPPHLQRKFDKQLKFLLSDPRYPSLRARKMGGEEKYEARLDKHNRFTYKTNENEIWLLTIGPHDEGLGKK